MKAISYILALCCLLSCTESAVVTPTVELMEQGRNERSEAKDSYRLAWDSYYKGVVHAEADEFQSAQKALFEAERIASEIGDYALLGRVYETLGTLYQNHKEEQKASAYQRQYAAFLDSVYKDERVAELVDRSQRYEREQVVAQLQQANLEARLVGLLTGVGIGLLLFSFGWAWKNRERFLSRMNVYEDDSKDCRLDCLMDSPLYCKLLPLMGKKREVKDFEMNGIQEKDWEDFFGRMDVAYARFVTRLAERYQLKDDYLKLSCLILLNIYPCNAKNVYYRTSSAVTNKKSRLAEKLGIRMSELEPFMKAFADGSNDDATLKTERK